MTFTPTQSWSVGIPCFNEAGTIREVVADLLRLGPCLATEFEVIVVDDASTDGSTELVRDLEAAHPEVRAIYHRSNHGIGRTVRDIYEAARMENVTYVPGDRQFDPAELVSYAEVEPGTYVSFSRRRKEVYSGFRYALSTLNRLVNRWFIGLDLQDVNWVNVYKREALLLAGPEIRSSIVVSEICAKLNVMGYRPIEPASVYHRRISGVSRGSSLANVLDVGRESLKLIRVVRRFRRRWPREDRR